MAVTCVVTPCLTIPCVTNDKLQKMYIFHITRNRGHTNTDALHFTHGTMCGYMCKMKL